MAGALNSFCCLCEWEGVVVASYSDPIVINDRIEMLVDSEMVYETFNTYLRMNQPEKKEIILRMDKPWEGIGSGIYSTVFKDHEGKFRMYYRGTAMSDDNQLGNIDKSEEQYTCLAVSDDGISWSKPELSLTDFRGSKKNNIIFSGRMAHNFSPFLDKKAKIPAEKLYKAVAGYAPEGLMAFESPDGLQWKLLKKTPIISKGAFDSHNLCFYDTNYAKYRCYSRYFAIPGTETQVIDFDDICIGVRAVQSNTSPDMLHWSESQVNTYEDGVPLEHFYTNATVMCPGAEHFYLSFPMRFMPERYKVEGHPHVGISDSVFMSSRNGVHFNRPFLDSWIRPDLDYRNWTQRNYITAWGILETSPEEFSLYVGEHYRWDDAFVRRYAVRKHGFASMYAPFEGGMFVTQPLRFTGDSLFLNYSTAAPGSIRVGIVADEKGWPAIKYSTEECDIIYGNELSHRVTWEGSGDVSRFSGKSVRLKFEMKAADLFAFRFGYRDNIKKSDKVESSSK
jgi:hypothetical protein